jgi:hypothetical protein
VCTIPKKGRKIEGNLSCGWGRKQVLIAWEVYTCTWDLTITINAIETTSLFLFLSFNLSASSFLFPVFQWLAIASMNFWIEN